MPGQGQLPLNAIAARSGFMTEPKLDPARDSFAARAFKAVGVFAILPYSRTSSPRPASASATAIVSLCTSRPTYVVNLSKTLLPMHEARPRHPRRNPRLACIL